MGICEGLSGSCTFRNSETRSNQYPSWGTWNDGGVLTARYHGYPISFLEEGRGGRGRGWEEDGEGKVEGWRRGGEDEDEKEDNDNVNYFRILLAMVTILVVAATIEKSVYFDMLVTYTA